jgi:hypothetical protein
MPASSTLDFRSSQIARRKYFASNPFASYSRYLSTGRAFISKAENGFWPGVEKDDGISQHRFCSGTSLVMTRAEVGIMKKLIVGLMGLMLVGAMALPVAAQGRNWNGDNQTTNLRRDNNRRNDFDRRDNRYEMERRRQNEYDNSNRGRTWQQRDHQNVRTSGVGTLLRVILRH